MKNIYLLFITILFSNYSIAQLLNPSFENGDSSSFEHWEAICHTAIPDSNAAPNSGEWAIKIFSGNTQGCVVPQYYQTITGLNDGDNLSVSGWVKSSGNILTGIGFAVKDGYWLDTIFALTTTGDTSWNYLSITGQVPENASDSVILILHPGLTGGPIGGEAYYGIFDGLELEINPTGTNEPEDYSIKIFPNPVAGNFLQMESTIPASDFKGLAIYSCIGRKVFQTSEYRRSVAVNHLPKGIYFLKITTLTGDLVRTFLIDRP